MAILINRLCYANRECPHQPVQVQSNQTFSLSTEIMDMIKTHWQTENNHSPFQSIVSLMSLLMTNLLTVVVKVFTNTSIYFQQKISMYLPYFKTEIVTSH